MNEWDICTMDRNGLQRRQVQDQFRLLWEQHVYWTRMVILGIAFDSPDLAASTNRLLRNATDFGRLFARYYGNAVGQNLERLFRDHLTIAGELVEAAKAGNTKAAADLEQRWYANSDEIARYLRRINPAWQVRPMMDMWHEHLSLTKQEAVAILDQDFRRSIAVFEEIEELALEMADEFSAGITGQFLR